MAKPSAFRAEISVNGDIHAADVLRNIGRRAYQTTPLMERLAGVLQKQQAARMRAKPYAPLESSTVVRKTNEGENPDVFRDEQRIVKGTPTRSRDALYNAVTQTSHPGQLRHITRASATFGLKSKGHGMFFYARFAQSSKTQTRKIMAISEADALELTTAVAHYIYSPAEKSSWGRL